MSIAVYSGREVSLSPLESQGIMFAKPAKKPGAATGKPKVANKTKTVSLKTGVKAPMAKKAKTDTKVNKSKPAPRQDAGYSLYSTDSEDQVATAFTEMETCERILTQLKSKQKEKTKGKKKKESSPKPKALNDMPPVSQVTNIADYRLPFSTALYLKHLQGQDPSTNPVYNSRLVSSTPDPEKPLADLSSSKLPSNLDQVSYVQGDGVGTQAKPTGNGNYPDTQDVPEKDVSASSSIPPSSNHLQNMADMVDMYRRIELRKYQQLQEATLIAELERLQSRQKENLHLSHETGFEPTLTSQGYTDQRSVSMGQGHQSIAGQGQVFSNREEKRQSEGFTGTGSLGFAAVDSVPSAFKPIPVDASQLSNANSGLYGSLDLDSDNGHLGRGSSITGFQPYLEIPSSQALPPSSWLTEVQKQQLQQQALQAIKDLDPGNHGNNGQGQGQVEQLKLLSDIVDGDKGHTTNKTNSTGFSHDTEYARVPRPVTESQGQGQGKGQSQINLVRKDDDIEVTKENGLYQIHRANDRQGEISDQNSDRSVISSKQDNFPQDIPEKDLPRVEQQGIPVSVNSVTSEGKETVSSQKDGSENLSDVSTPRNQNSSGASTGVSQPGRVVFIPNNNSGSQNVIGYIPGIPIATGLNQPINLPVTHELAPDGSVLSAVTGANQGQATMQTTSQVTSQNISGSSYHSNSQANNIAAGDIGVRKLRYLLKELKECNKVTRDVEINRLVTEIDSTVNSIPQLSLTFNIHTEIELAMQPLRSENSQLRRKLRLINQQLKDKEEACNKDINFESKELKSMDECNTILKLHLQTSNECLQKVLKEEKEIKTRLAAEVQHVHAELHKMRVERSKMIAEVSEKETLNLKFRQETLMETQKLGHEVQMMKKEQEASANKLEALEKENHILQITLQQRDAEIERQHNVVETMKQSVTDLLQELEQSRTGEQVWDQNQSYGLGKLMRIMEEEETGYLHKQPPHDRGQRARKRTPERRQFDFNTTTESSTSTAKLTREALAKHDRRHTPDEPRIGASGRQGPASESELDTLVELNRRGREVTQKHADNAMFTQPVRRRTSSSSPVRFRKSSPSGAHVQMDEVFHSRLREKVGNLRDTSGFELYERHGEKQNLVDRSSARTKQGLSKSCENSPSSKTRPRYSDISTTLKRISNEGHKVSSNRTDVSDEQSRYSVTEYFRKYPKSSLEGQSSSLDDPRLFVPQGQRSYPEKLQPGRHVSRAKPPRPQSQFQTSSEIEDLTVKPVNVPRLTNVKQRTLFKGMNYDETISAIPDDDQLSSVSMSSVTTANTVDDKRFRNGIATLDANIAKLQMALQKTKSMLT